jgi:hypothetical protein
VQFCDLTAYQRHHNSPPLQWNPNFLDSNSVQQSPYWEPDSRKVSEELPRFLWNPKVHYHRTRSSWRVYKSCHSTPSWATWIQFTSAHPIYTRTILPFTHRYPKQFLNFRFSRLQFYMNFSFPPCIHLNVLDFITLIIFRRWLSSGL